MSSGERFAWWDAFCIADEILQRMDGAADRIAIAGSIRRGKADVGDIEIVCIPNANTETRLMSLVQSRVLTQPLINRGAGRKASPTWGEKIKFARHAASGINVQFFAASPENWGYIYWLRTGPGDANSLAVTPKGKPSPAQGRPGILPHELRFHDGQLWRLPEPSTDRGALPAGAMIVPTRDEMSVFTALGIDYLLPGERTVERYSKLADGWRMVRDLHPVHLLDGSVWSPSGRVWVRVQSDARARMISREQAMGAAEMERAG